MTTTIITEVVRNNRRTFSFRFADGTSGRTKSRARRYAQAYLLQLAGKFIGGRFPQKVSTEDMHVWDQRHNERRLWALLRCILVRRNPQDRSSQRLFRWEAGERPRCKTHSDSVVNASSWINRGHRVCAWCKNRLPYNVRYQNSILRARAKKVETKKSLPLEQNAGKRDVR